MKYCYQKIYFESDTECGVCHICGSNLERTIKDEGIIYLGKCEKKVCELNGQKYSHNTKKSWVLPVKDYNKWKNSNSHFNVGYWIKKGMTEEQAKRKLRENSIAASKKSIAKRKIAPFSSSYKYIAKKMKGEGFTDKDIDIRILKLRESKIKNCHFSNSYWMSQGYTKKETKELIENIRSKALQTKKETKLKDPTAYADVFPTQIQYWIKKGYSIEDANKKVSSHQTTFSKDICIEKHGEKKGMEIWNDRQEKWQKTLMSKSEEEYSKIQKSKGLPKDEFIKKHGLDKFISANLKRFKNGKFYSKEASSFFKVLENSLIDIDVVTRKEKDEFWKYGNGRINFYDWAIEDLKIIIEYNGTHCHPDPKMTPEDMASWKNLYTKENAQTCYHKEKLKSSLVENVGFKVFNFYSNENEEEFITMVSKYIKEQYEIFHSGE